VIAARFSQYKVGPLNEGKYIRLCRHRLDIDDEWCSFVQRGHRQRVYKKDRVSFKWMAQVPLLSDHRRQKKLQGKGFRGAGRYSSVGCLKPSEVSEIGMKRGECPVSSWDELCA
jgi:hypothetical protein